MKVQIKNSNYSPKAIKSLFTYFEMLSMNPLFDFNGLHVEIDPTIDFRGNDALIRWTDIDEGFNDKVIVNSLQEFQSNFRLLDA